MKSSSKSVRAALGAACLAMLGGCESTALVPLTAYALDGLSYASSGKGLTDHAISAANNKDCALFRAVQGGQICETGPSVEVAPALAMTDTGGVSATDAATVRELLARAPEMMAPASDAVTEKRPNLPFGASKNPKSLPFN